MIKIHYPAVRAFNRLSRPINRELDKKYTGIAWSGSEHSEEWLRRFYGTLHTVAEAYNLDAFDLQEQVHEAALIEADWQEEKIRCRVWEEQNSNYNHIVEEGLRHASRR